MRLRRIFFRCLNYLKGKFPSFRNRHPTLAARLSLSPPPLHRLFLFPSRFYIRSIRNWNFRNDLGDRARPLRLSRRSAMFIFREALTAGTRRRVCHWSIRVCVLRSTRFLKIDDDDVGIRSGRERRAREATGGGQNWLETRKKKRIAIPSLLRPLSREHE